MKKLLISVFLIIITIGSSFAQDSIPEPAKKKKQSFLTDRRHWTIEIPVWIPGFRGEFAYGDVALEGEDGNDLTPENPIEKPDFGDAFKRLFKSQGNLNFLFVTSISYSNKKFYSELDLFSGTVGADLLFRFNNKQLVSASVHSDLFRLNGGYQIFGRPVFSEKARYNLFAYGGIRLQNFKITSDLDRIGRTLKVHPLWIDPVLGVRNELSFNYWQFVVQADMGSFGINDKFSYMLNLHTFYRISNLLSFKLGWNAWYVKYNDRFKDESLRLKVHLAGPAGALVFNF